MSTIRETPAPGPVTVRRALLSVSDKAGLVPFAQALQARGVTLLSTGGTAKALADAGLPVVNVSDVTRFPEMLDGRVKTLHPNVHGGILARRHVPDDLAAISAHGIEPIDLVVVNLYPFAKAAADPATRFDALIEEIDIGGPSMVRAAAKNWRDVLIVTDPADYPRVLDDLASPGGSNPAFRFDLARRAFAHTAAYDATIASTLEAIGSEGDPFGRPAEPPALPTTIRLSLPRRRILRYGENPHQAAGWYAIEPAQGFGAVDVKQGKELSYTNLLDLDAAARLALEFDEPAAAVIKHANPCGVATAATIAEAYVTARDADALSAFGGIIGLNRELDAATATAITSTFIEAVIAPAVTADALAILAKRANLRVLTADFDAFRDAARPGVELRSILGGVLVQERDRVLEARTAWPDAAVDALKVVTTRQPTAAEWQALRFAWRVCAHVKSNTILFTGPDRTRAVGAGQMSRVDAVRVAVLKAGGTVPGSVVASDAFFPFRDGLDALAAAGATAVVQPGGSVRDAEVIAAADEHGLTMVFTGRRHFRH
jgi:phosphoribosylaminoimidazolecarboxamide formyltransferase/IMP cyclohydrolase